MKRNRHGSNSYGINLNPKSTKQSFENDFETLTGKRLLSGEEGKLELQNLINTLIEYSFSQSNECFTLFLDIHAGVNTPHKTEVHYKLQSG